MLSYLFTEGRGHYSMVPCEIDNGLEEHEGGWLCAREMDGH